MSEQQNRYGAVYFRKLDLNAVTPEYKTEGSAGADISSIEEVMLEPGDTRAIHTGIVVAVPRGGEMQVRTRSGLALKGIVVANSPGTIDWDYRGEVMVILHNQSRKIFKVEKGMRIAQLLFAPVCRYNFIEADALDETERGAKGFGSTGLT
jgi:dUTP pyrophosphatase